MGNTIKHRFLTAAVSLSLFVLGSAGVATAQVQLGVATFVGKIRGTEWCGTVIDQTAPFLNDPMAKKERIKDDIVIVMDLTSFPVMSAAVRIDPREFLMTGIGVRKNPKHLLFTMEGSEMLDPSVDIDLFMNGSIKLGNRTGMPKNILGTPINIESKFFSQTRSDHLGGHALLHKICVGDGMIKATP